MNTIDLVPIALKAKSYRDILAEALKQSKSKRTAFSYSILAHKIGCSSKSYPREVITGRRILTMEYAPRFAAAFKLKGDIKKLFIKLVELERTQDPEALQQEIRKLKQRIQEKVEHQTQSPSEIFARTIWVDLYAALGSAETGASLTEISQRTGFDLQKTEVELKAMIETGVIRYEPQTHRYFAGVPHHFFELADEDELFKSRFVEVLDRAKKKSVRQMTSKEDLFMCSTISVNSKAAVRFKAELRELVNRFVQDAEDPNGDRNCQILVSMFL